MISGSKMKRIKKNEPPTKFTGSYKKDCISVADNK